MYLHLWNKLLEVAACAFGVTRGLHACVGAWRLHEPFGGEMSQSLRYVVVPSMVSEAFPLCESRSAQSACFVVVRVSVSLSDSFASHGLAKPNRWFTTAPRVCVANLQPFALNTTVSVVCRCDSECATCDGPDADQCASCRDGFLLIEGFCLPECAPGACVCVCVSVCVCVCVKEREGERQIMCVYVCERERVCVCVCDERERECVRV